MGASRAKLGAERFLAEIETTANLQHPHILPLFEVPDAYYFANFTTSFDISPDGESFLIGRVSNVTTPERRRFVLVKNALAEYRASGR